MPNWAESFGWGPLLSAIGMIGGTILGVISLGCSTNGKKNKAKENIDILNSILSFVEKVNGQIDIDDREPRTLKSNVLVAQETCQKMTGCWFPKISKQCQKIQDYKNSSIKLAASIVSKVINKKASNYNFYSNNEPKNQAKRENIRQFTEGSIASIEKNIESSDLIDADADLLVLFKNVVANLQAMGEDVSGFTAIVENLDEHIYGQKQLVYTGV